MTPLSSSKSSVPPGPEPDGASVSTPSAASAGEWFILGVTSQGRVFRPSDWSERLAGVMSRFRPEGAFRGAVHLGYSPYCLPTVIDGVKCVVVKEAVRDVEPMAWDFVMNFARDNDLQVTQACLIPEPPSKSPPSGR